MGTRADFYIGRRPLGDKLYTEEIQIECKPYDGFRNKWYAVTVWPVDKPYGRSYGLPKKVEQYGKTPQEAVEKLKDKLCKITAIEERKHLEYQEWKAGIKITSFSRDQDCNPVVPRKKLFENT